MAAYGAAGLAGVVSDEIHRAREAADFSLGDTPVADLGKPLLQSSKPTADAAEEESSGVLCTPRRQIMFGIVLCFIFMTLEVVGGYLSGSLALYAE